MSVKRAQTLPKYNKVLEMIHITVNGQSKVISEQTSVSKLLIDLKRAGGGIAIAVNQKVIPKMSWVEHLLKRDDKVLIIKATQGG